MKNLMLLGMVLMAAGAARAEPVKLLVDFDDDATIEDVRDSEEETGLDLVPSSFMFSATKLTEVWIEREDAADFIDQLDDDFDIEAVELSQTYVALGGAEFQVPNDPGYRQQRWHMDMIGLQKAWRHSTGKGVVVAVLDTGVSDGNSADFPRIGDLERSTFLPGYNFIDDSEKVYDDNGHGSHVASSIVEATNNAVAGVGTSYEAKLIPVKVLSGAGSGSTDSIAEAIIWATDAGANIINLSLGGGGRSDIMDRAVKYAVDRNVMVFASAGNSAVPRIGYPAASPGAFAISSVGPDGTLATYSQYGEGGDGIFIASPGGDTRKAGPEGAVFQSTIFMDRNSGAVDPKRWGFYGLQGTSMAGPIAAGSAALVASALMEKNGGRFDAKETAKILRETATQKGDPFKYGAGIVNAGAGVQMVAGKTNYAPFIAGFAALGAALIGFLLFRRRN